MKKLLSILLLLFLLFTLLACNSVKESESKNDNKNSTTNTSANSTAIGNYDSAIAYFYNLEEYQDYIQSHKMPDNFVTYEDISALGAFDGFVWNSSNSFYYSIVNGEAQFGLDIFTNYTPTKLRTVTPLESTANSDMSVCPGTSYGTEYFSYHDVQYMYSYGNLAIITWDVGSTRFQLHLGPASDNYEGDNVVINALLNKDTAGSVNLAYDNMMAKKAA